MPFESPFLRECNWEGFLGTNGWHFWEHQKIIYYIFTEVGGRVVSIYTSNIFLNHVNYANLLIAPVAFWDPKKVCLIVQKIRNEKNTRHWDK